MKKLLVILMLIIAIPAFAGSLQKGDQLYESKQGNVTFLHDQHQGVLPDCMPCHVKYDLYPNHKDLGHKYCKVCHLNHGLPALCTDCHKK